VEIDGAQLRYLRKLAGYNLIGFAKLPGCPFQYLSQFETGARRACSPALVASFRETLKLADRTVLLPRDDKAAA